MRDFSAHGNKSGEISKELKIAFIGPLKPLAGTAH